MSILIGIFTFVLVLLSALLILVVLAQKSKDGGMGAALGGGMTEATFGAETGRFDLQDLSATLCIHCQYTDYFQNRFLLLVLLCLFQQEANRSLASIVKKWEQTQL